MRWYWWIAVAALLIVVLPGLGVGAYFYRFYAPVPQANFPAPEGLTEARLQDLEHLSRLPSIDRSFSEAEVRAFVDHMTQMRDRAGARGHIVGSEIGDFEQFWAEGGGTMELPNSHLHVSITTGYHDWENGCRSWTRCYWLSAAMGVAAGPLTPDIPAPLLFADYARGIDNGMQAILNREEALAAPAGR